MMRSNHFFDVRANRQKLDNFLTRDPREPYCGSGDPEDFVLTCLLVETYDKEGRLVNQSTLDLDEYPQLTARDHTTGEYQLNRITLHWQDGSEMNVTRNEP